MKKFTNISIIYFLLILAACGKKEEPTPEVQLTPQQQVAETLNGGWELESIIGKPEHVEASELDGFSIRFSNNVAKTGGDFTSENNRGLIGPNGRWSFVDDSSEKINLLDHAGVVGTGSIKIENSRLTFSFTTPSEPINARSLGIDGDYSLQMIRK